MHTKILWTGNPPPQVNQVMIHNSMYDKLLTPNTQYEQQPKISNVTREKRLRNKIPVEAREALQM